MEFAALFLVSVVVINYALPKVGTWLFYINAAATGKDKKCKEKRRLKMGILTSALGLAAVALVAFLLFSIFRDRNIKLTRKLKALAVLGAFSVGLLGIGPWIAGVIIGETSGSIVKTVIILFLKAAVCLIVSGICALAILSLTVYAEIKFEKDGGAAKGIDENANSETDIVNPEKSERRKN